MIQIIIQIDTIIHSISHNEGIFRWKNRWNSLLFLFFIISIIFGIKFNSNDSILHFAHHQYISHRSVHILHLEIGLMVILVCSFCPKALWFKSTIWIIIVIGI